MHTLVDPGTKVWTLEYAVSFADIWASESYKATGMSEKAPVLALVHPKNPNMVYFFVEVTSLRTTDFYGLYVLAHSLQDESGGAVPRRWQRGCGRWRCLRRHDAGRRTPAPAGPPPHPLAALPPAESPR